MTGRRVFIGARDLVFRAKLAGVVRAAGAEVAPAAAACDLAVLDAEIPGAVDRVRGFVQQGIAVIAYGPHVRPDLLRLAREAGATAVPNSQAEERLRALLTSTPPPTGSGGASPAPPSAGSP